MFPNKAKLARQTAALRKATQDAMAHVIADNAEIAIGMDDMGVVSAEEAGKNPLYVKVQVPVIGIIKSKVYNKVTKKMDDKETLRVQYLTVGEPKDALYTEHDIFQVYVSDSARAWITKDVDSVRSRAAGVLELATRVAKSYYGNRKAHLIGMKKSRVVFSDAKREDMQIFQEMCHADNSRMEHFIQLVTARGFKTGEGLNIPLSEFEQVRSKVEDGIVFGLTVEDGQRVNLQPGWYQFRSLQPYAKGLILVSENIKKSYINWDSVKIKQHIKHQYGKWGLNTDRMVVIKGYTLDAEVYDLMDSRDNVVSNSIIQTPGSSPLKFTHQMGYCLNHESKWGTFPEYMERLATSEEVEKVLPSHIQRLKSIGFLPEEIILSGYDMQSLIKRFRPEIGSMYPFAMIDASRYGVQEGWYYPEPVKPSNYVCRFPFLATGGGFQEVEWAGCSHSIDGMRNILVLAITEGSEYHKQVQPMITALGIDTDGDLAGVVSEDGAEMLKAAGLTISQNVPDFKASEKPFNFGWDDNGFFELWVYSLQNINKLGAGDKITRNCRDLLDYGLIDQKIYDKIALYGANVVQVGASAYKKHISIIYKFTLEKIYKAMMKHAEKEGHGFGFDFDGPLYGKVRSKIADMLTATGMYSGDTAEFKIQPSYRQHKWDTESFNQYLQEYNPELGTDYVTYIKQGFFAALKAESIDTKKVYSKRNMTPEEAQDWYQEVKEDVDKVRGMVAYYIKHFPERQSVYAYLIDQGILVTGQLEDKKQLKSVLF